MHEATFANVSQFDSHVIKYAIMRTVEKTIQHCAHAVSSSGICFVLLKRKGSKTFAY